MKVLMFGWEFPPHISGGLGTACQGITQGLTANDVSVLFVIPKANGDEEQGSIKVLGAADVPLSAPQQENARFREAMTFFEVNCPVIPYLGPEEFCRYSEARTELLEAKATTASPVRYPFTGGYGKDLMKEVWQYALVATAIAGGNAHDIIHAHDWLSFPAGIMAKAVSGKPLVVHVHATEFDRSGENINMQVYETERQGMLQADRIIAVSERTRRTIIDRYFIDPEKVETIHNALEAAGGLPEKRKAPFREKIVSFIGRITYQKGPGHFIEAAAKILAKDKGFRFIMAGSGDMMFAMIEKAAQLRISRYIHFTGFLDATQRDKLLAASDVFVMPSVSEPFGIVPLEAIKAGVPVIITKQSGVQEVLQYALKTDWWDTDALAESIYSLASYNGLSRMLSRESRREVESLRWEKQGNVIRELYQRVMDGKHQ